MEMSDHPHWAAVQKIYHTLVANGYKAYLAGGCVRDFLLGRPANDLDLATDATPDTIERLFTKTVSVGRAFGVMLVIEDGVSFEVATFRSDGAYVNGRHPEHVVFTTPEEDALRRDFTVNALFYDLHQGRVLDFVGGVEDLRRKVIKAVGDAETRFGEDHLRLLRAVRFSAQLDFEIESATFQAVRKGASLVRSVSAERIHEETFKLLKAQNPLRGLTLLEKSGLGAELFPGWTQTFARASMDFAKLFATRASDEALLWTRFLAPWVLSRTAGWKQILADYRFSKLLAKDVGKALQLLETSKDFFSASEGERLLQLRDPGAHLFLEICASLNIEPSAVSALQRRWDEWGRTMPEPLIRAADLKMVSGKELGELLKRCYLLQLQNPESTKEQIMNQALKILTT
jgi:tRNA nucleotidyltransferase (CCA-adding enzyme)